MAHPVSVLTCSLQGKTSFHAQIYWCCNSLPYHFLTQVHSFFAGFGLGVYISLEQLLSDPFHMKFSNSKSEKICPFTPASNLCLSLVLPTRPKKKKNFPLLKCHMWLGYIHLFDWLEVSWLITLITSAKYFLLCNIIAGMRSHYELEQEKLEKYL